TCVGRWHFMIILVVLNSACDADHSMTGVELELAAVEGVPGCTDYGITVERCLMIQAAIEAIIGNPNSGSCYQSAASLDIMMGGSGGIGDGTFVYMPSTHADYYPGLRGGTYPDNPNIYLTDNAFVSDEEVLLTIMHEMAHLNGVHS